MIQSSFLLATESCQTPLNILEKYTFICFFVCLFFFSGNKAIHLWNLAFKYLQ